MRNAIAGAVLACAQILTGCGGGGGNDAPASTGTPQGLWQGSTNTNRAVTGIVLSDGTYYVLYSSAGNANVIAGVVQGTGSSDGGTFASNNAKDFNLEGLGVLPASVSASYTQKQSLAGSIVYNTGSVTFSSSYNAAYETTPTLAAVAGTYTGQVALSVGIQTATLTVSSGGAIAGIGNGCSFTGTATPRTDGNAYNASITFGGAPCFFANQTFAGIGYFDAPNKRLYAAAPNAARTDGVLFVGTKP